MQFSQSWKQVEQFSQSYADECAEARREEQRGTKLKEKDRT
jgi:hypothetical protein